MREIDEMKVYSVLGEHEPLFIEVEDGSKSTIY